MDTKPEKKIEDSVEGRPEEEEDDDDDNDEFDDAKAISSAAIDASQQRVDADDDNDDTTTNNNNENDRQALGRSTGIGADESLQPALLEVHDDDDDAEENSRVEHDTHVTEGDEAFEEDWTESSEESESEDSEDGDSDDKTMSLEEHERRWALELKQQVEASDTLKNLGDMEYCQFALMAQGDTPKALERIQGLQWFRDTYKIDNSPDQGIQCLRELCGEHPGYLLNLDICPITGEGIVAISLKDLDREATLKPSPGGTGMMMIERNWRIPVCAKYYILRTMAPSFQSIREGIFILADAHGRTWKDFSMNYDHRLYGELMWCYPFDVKCLMEYNSNTVSTVFWGLVKRLVPGWNGIMKSGCQVECNSIYDPQSSPRTLTELYMQPNPQEATQYMLSRAKELLTIRATNEAAFRL